LRKIDFILLLIFICTGCSVFRNAENRNGLLKYDSKVNVTIPERVREKNITRNNFYIPKAEIQISTPEGNQNLIVGIKYCQPDKYLLTVKSRTGIEAGRILLSHDTILGNDRINRKYYYGSALYLKNNYGITDLILAVLLGDYVSDNSKPESTAGCINGKLEVNQILDGVRIKYVIDCKSGKSSSVIIANRLNEKEIEVYYDKFIISGNIITPGNILIKNLKRNTTIDIRIRKIESPWNGKIEFIPGSRYELIKLL
jgi:hypothetical protein